MFFAGGAKWRWRRSDEGQGEIARRETKKRERERRRETGGKGERTGQIHLRIETADRPGERTSRRGITGINTSRNYRARGYIPVCIPGVAPAWRGAASRAG